MVQWCKYFHFALGGEGKRNSLLAWLRKVKMGTLDGRIYQEDILTLLNYSNLTQDLSSFG